MVLPKLLGVNTAPSARAVLHQARLREDPLVPYKCRPGASAQTCDFPEGRRGLMFHNTWCVCLLGERLPAHTFVTCQWQLSLALG